MKVCLLHSEGPHGAKAVAAIRRAYPGASVTVVARGAESGGAYIALPGPLAIDSPGPGARRGFLGVVRAVRGHRPSAFVVLFPSFPLRLIAACSGAPAWHCGPDGRLHPLGRSAAGLLADEGRRRVRGLGVWFGIWLAVRFRPVRPR